MQAALPDPSYHPEFYDSVTTKRAIAWFIDVIIIGVIVAISIPFTGFLGLFFLPFLYFCMSFAYRVVTISSGSATFGMRLMSLELRDSAGQRLDFSMACLHTLGYFISMAFFLAQIASIVLILTSERGQSLSDHVLGTVMLNKRAGNL